MKEALLNGWKNGGKAFIFCLIVSIIWSAYWSHIDGFINLQPFYVMMPPIIIYMIVIAIKFYKNR